MIYTYNIQKAIRFSIDVHELNRPERQLRKGKNIAYITHPFTVGLILARAGASEEVIIAGILHDTIEDSHDEHKVTAEDIKAQFGAQVARLVSSVSETDKSLTWEERKTEALKHIRRFSNDSLLVKAGDIISNCSELIQDYEEHGDSVFKRFNAPQKWIIQHYLRAITAILKRWSDIPLADDLRHVARGLQSIQALEFMHEAPARTMEYAEYSEDMPLTCSVCGWKGTPKESGWIGYDSEDCLDVSCPNCEKMLLVVAYPLANKAD